MNKFVYILCEIVFIISGFEIYITKECTFHYYEPLLYLSNYSILAGLVFIVTGLLLIIYTPKNIQIFSVVKNAIKFIIMLM